MSGYVYIFLVFLNCHCSICKISSLLTIIYSVRWLDSIFVTHCYTAYCIYRFSVRLCLWFLPACITSFFSLFQVNICSNSTQVYKIFYTSANLSQFSFSVQQFQHCIKHNLYTDTCSRDATRMQMMASPRQSIESVLHDWLT